jgi:tRNA(Ile)-lysidine synthase
VSVVDLARDTIRRHAMLAGGEAVLVAVSGGADSVALLHVLATLTPSFGLRLSVAHVDHQLRPDSSQDAEFVRELAGRFGLPIDVAPVDIPRRGSVEAGAREARYAALDASATRVGADRIAVGHTADDQAETVMMRLFEGAGPRGLAGIPPVRGRIIRPLLAARRADLVAELERVGLPWIEDPSNRDVRFFRNQIRHEILPLVAKYNPGVVGALNRTAALARETLGAIERLAASELARSATIEPHAITLPLARLQALPSGVAAEVLRQAADRLGGRGPLRAWAQRGLRRLVVEPPPQRAFKLGGLTVEVSAGRLRLGRRSPPVVVPRELLVPGTTTLPETGLAVHAAVVDALQYDVPRGGRVAAFDAERLSRPLIVRARRRGDRFTPFGSVTRRLKAFLISEKVPRWERDVLPLVEANGEIVWVAGVRRGAAAPVTPATRKILELALVPIDDTASLQDASLLVSPRSVAPRAPDR